MPATPMTASAPDDPIEQALLQVPLFQELPPVVCGLLRECCEHRRYDAGQTVFALGQYDGAEFFAVASGRLRASIVDPATGAIVVEDFGPHSVFGLETALSENSAETCERLAVTAEEDLALVAIDADAFRKLAASRPSLMRKVASHLADQAVALRYGASAAQTAPEQRVFAVLLQHVARDPMSGAWRIQKMPKHRELADEADVDETLAASAVATLIQEGVAQRDYPGLIINDMRQLNRLSGQG